MHAVDFNTFMYKNWKIHKRNRQYSYSRYWTGASLDWRLMRQNIIKDIYFVWKLPRMSLLCKLVPFQYQDFVSFLKRMFSHKVLGFCAQSAVTNMHWHWLKKQYSVNLKQLVPKCKVLFNNFLSDRTCHRLPSGKEKIPKYNIFNRLSLKAEIYVQ